MTTIIRRILTWHHRRQERKIRERSAKCFIQGFDWAMGELTRRTLTCDEVCEKCSGVFDYTDFDRGGLHAVSVYRSVGHAAATQFDIIEQQLIQ